MSTAFSLTKINEGGLLSEGNKTYMVARLFFFLSFSKSSDPVV